MHPNRFNVFETDVSGHIPLITRERHRVLLEVACNHLEAFLAICRYLLCHTAYIAKPQTLIAPEDIVLGAEELRYAARAVGKVSGAIDVEEVLDGIFSSFCIGK